MRMTTVIASWIFSPCLETWPSTPVLLSSLPLPSLFAQEPFLAAFQTDQTEGRSFEDDGQLCNQREGNKPMARRYALADAPCGSQCHYQN